MMNEEEHLNNQFMQHLLEEFKDTYKKFHEDNIMEYNSIKSSKDSSSQLKIFKQKYPYFKNPYSKCLIHKLFNYPEFNKFKSINEFKQGLYKTLGNKIKGIFKHGQCAKTEISCTKIISDMKKGIITIAITKNTLLANKQWTTRCIKLMINNGLTDLKKKIMVISHKFNDLDGNATHCKNLSDAWCKISSNDNNYMVIFVCANTQRVSDICDLLHNFYAPTFNSNMRKNIVVQFDEAHNKMSGVPTCRESIENMLIYDFVIEFVPITASNKPINDESNPLWREENIRKKKLNYLNDDLAKSKIKSNDPNYSSIGDATIIKINDSEEKTTEPLITKEIPMELFKTHYPKKNYDDLGYLNACPVWLCGDEETVLKKAYKILDNPEWSGERQVGDSIEISDVKIFKKDETNFHIMITPCRTVITEMIMKHAIKKNYNPVVIGLYGGCINYKYRDDSTGKIYKNKFGKGIELNADKSKEFNENLYVWLRKNNLLKRPVIILGNYQNVGESNTFVNSDYGYLRSVILLPGCNLDAEQHYQYLLRGCFLLERFTGTSKNSVEKYIIGYEKGINDALFYEKLNDDIVQELIDKPDESEFQFEYDNEENSSSNSTQPKKIMSIPVQFKIEDDECEFVKIMKEIMKMDSHSRTPEDKSEFMNNLILAIKDTSVIKHDKNNDYKIKLDEFILKEFRCYKKTYNSDSYRFKGYYDRWVIGHHYENGELEIGECGFYGCVNKHISSDGHVNNPNTFYILFAYSS